ncbi:MAG: hypothetical protein JST82_13535 [Bacteroidetes bacterium]|nr:hypothetical protein [Bacteroidota bacterium]
MSFSCKKNYNCTCTYPAGSGYEPYNNETGKVSRKEAREFCEKADKGAKILGGKCVIQ